MAVRTYLYNINYKESNGVFFTQQQLLCAGFLRSNCQFNRYIGNAYDLNQTLMQDSLQILTIYTFTTPVIGTQILLLVVIATEAY